MKLFPTHRLAHGIGAQVAAGQVAKLGGSNGADGLQLVGIIGGGQAGDLHENPSVAEGEGGLVAAAQLTHEVVLHHGEFGLGNEVGVQTVDFGIDFADKRLDMGIVGIGLYGEDAVVWVGHHIGGDAIGVAAAFTDVLHEPAAEIASEKGDKHAELQVVGMGMGNGELPHADGTLQSVGMWNKMAFPFGCVGRKGGYGKGRLRTGAESTGTEKGLDATHGLRSDVTGSKDGKSAGMIVTGIKPAKRVGSEPMIIVLDKQMAARVPVAKEGLKEGTMGLHTDTRAIDPELLEVVGHNGLKRRFGEKRLYYKAMKHFEGMGKIAAQRVEGDTGMGGRTGEFEPSTVVVELIGYLRGGKRAASLAQHAIGKECLQRLRLVPTPPVKEQVYAYHLLIASGKQVDLHAIGESGYAGRLNREAVEGLNGRLVHCFQTFTWRRASF